MNQLHNALIINIMVSLLFFWYNIRKGNGESLIRLIVMLFFPVGGLLIFLTVDNLGVQDEYNVIQLEKLAGDFNVQESFFLKKLNVQREINIVPVKEALAINDNSIKRKLIVDSLKDDNNDCHSFLKDALKDNDTETSHYAAAAVVEIRRKLTIRLQELGAKCEEDPNNINIAKEYATVVSEVIKNGFLDKANGDRYLNRYSELLKHIIKLDSTDESMFEEKINCDIKLREYDEAIEYCNLLKKRDENNMKPYILLLKVYYELKNKKKFGEVLEIVKKSKEGMEIEALGNLRFWTRGEA